MAAGPRLNTQVLGDLLRHEAALDPDRNFVQCGSDWMTLGELDRLSDRGAAGLQKLGVRKGDRVAVNLPNQVEYVVLVYAIAKAGAIQVPINTFLRGEFLRHQVAESGASVLITDGAGLQMTQPLIGELTELRQIVLVGEAPDGADLPATVPVGDLLSCEDELVRPEMHESDVCVIFYTSGTTGPSKGCVISHGYYCFIPRAFIDYGWCRPGDVVFGASPLFHFSGQVWLVAMALSARGSVVVEPTFSATTFISRAREVGATVVFGMGAMAMAVLAQPPSEQDRDHSIRHMTWVPATEAVQQTIEDRFGVTVISEVCGQSECWPTTLSPVDGPRRRASVGRAVPGIAVKLVDDYDDEVPVGEVGEFIVRADVPNRLFQGYWNNPEATAHAFRNLWHHTGDNGRMDADGFFYFVDRKKDSLRRRGENVSSIELEQAIMKHPAVLQAAVHAVPSELTEDDIKACIVLQPDTKLEAEELFEFFKKTCPYYAIPRYVEFLDELPANVAGRVQKFALRNRGITENTIDFDKLGLVVAREDRRKA